MSRWGAMIAAAMLAFAMTGCSATGRGINLVDGADLGRGPNGELCRAERIFGEKNLGSFDGAYALRCRGWSETDSVGRFYDVGNAAATQAQLEADQKNRLLCAEPVSFAVSGGGMTMRRCIDRGSGYRSVAILVKRGGKLYVGDVLEQFQGSLADALKTMAGVERLPETKNLPEISVAMQAAEISPAAGGARRDVSQAVIDSRRREALGYNLRAQYSEARDIITRYYAQLPEAASQQERIDYLMEMGLSESNLGYHDLALAYLDEAQKLLDKDPALKASQDEILSGKLPVYRAIMALNRRDFAAASKAAVEALDMLRGQDTAKARTATVNAAPLADPAILQEVNGGVRTNGLNGSWDMATVRSSILQAQALYAHGAALQALGSAREAGVELAGAASILAGIEKSGLEVSNLQWLTSAVSAERARVAVSLGDRAAADREFQSALQGLAKLSLYADSPLLAQRHISYAAFLASSGNALAAQDHYQQAIRILIRGGPSSAAGVTGLSEYLRMQAAAAATGGPAGETAKADFFLAAQLVAPPAVAEQLAQIQKVFEAGSGPAATRAKALQDLDREIRTFDTKIAALPADADADRARLGKEQANLVAKTAQIRGELGADGQYQQATDAVVQLADLQKTLKPDEAYFRLVALPRASYGMVVTASGAAIYPISMSTKALSDLVGKVRKTIDGSRAMVFDVAGAQQIYAALFDPAKDMIANAGSLVVEPSGPLAQLPFGVLVEDRGSVAWFAENVRKNSRDYTQVRFLAAAKNISTTISPRAFLIARSQPASSAPRPFIGFGNHQKPDGAVLDGFPSRDSELGSRCGLRGAELRNAFGRLPPLGQADLDIAQKALGGGHLYEGSGFTDRKVMAMGGANAEGGGDQLSQYNVVYFATHGLKEGELGCPNPPALVTSIGQDADSDGLLSFREIANLHLDANLVVLSACNTAATATESQSRGAGFRSNAADSAATLNGLVRAFLVAGSRSVLTTHWAIPIEINVKGYGKVEPSALLMERFFKNGASMPVAQALREAQAAMIDNVPTSNPYYWGAFALVGDGSRTMLEHRIIASGPGEARR